MNINRLKYFIDIVSLGSFGKAAEHNYISQSAVSQQITATEDELGFPLFWRSKGKAALTLAGKCFYEKVQSIYDNYCQAVRFAKYIYDKNNGALDSQPAAEWIILPLLYRISNAPTAASKFILNR